MIRICNYYTGNWRVVRTATGVQQAVDKDGPREYTQSAVPFMWTPFGSAILMMKEVFFSAWASQFP